jgi:hypothetical protein
MMRGLIALAVLIVVGALKLPVERDLAKLHREEHFRGVEFNLDLREKIGQLAIVPAHHNASTKSALVLGHSGLAHGLERERCRDE